MQGYTTRAVFGLKLSYDPPCRIAVREIGTIARVGCTAAAVQLSAKASLIRAQILARAESREWSTEEQRCQERMALPRIGVEFRTSNSPREVLRERRLAARSASRAVWVDA